MSSAARKKTVQFGTSDTTENAPTFSAKSKKLSGKKRHIVEDDEEEEEKGPSSTTDSSAVEDNKVQAIREISLKRSAQERAGVKFPISRLAKFAKNGRYAERVG